MNVLEYQDIPVYAIELPVHGKMDVFYFTSIPFGELKRIRRVRDHGYTATTELENQIFRHYTLPRKKWDYEEIDSLPGGTVTTIAQVILLISESGLQEPERLVEFDTLVNMDRFRIANDMESEMMSLVCSVYSGYTFETLQKLPFDKIRFLFASAERYLINVGILDGPYNFLLMGDTGLPEAPQGLPQEPMSIEEIMAQTSRSNMATQPVSMEQSHG